MQLGSNGAALRQHMWKIFSYCNTKVRQSAPRSEKVYKEHKTPEKVVGFVCKGSGFL